LMAVVVFPTPPFWFVTAIIRPKLVIVAESGEGSCYADFSPVVFHVKQMMRP